MSKEGRRDVSPRTVEESLVLRGGCDVSMHREVGQERLDLGCGGAEVLARPQAVATDESYAPFHRGALGVNEVVVETEYLSHCIEELGLLPSRRVRPRRSPAWRPESAANGQWAQLPETRTIIALSGQHGM